MKVIEDALTFDDVLLVPDYSEVLPKNVTLKSNLTDRMKLNLPLLSAAMDTVTESRLAIALAQLGGIGIIHKNMSPRAQAAEVAKVKKFESGVVQNPVTITPNTTIAEINKLSKQLGYSGFPVIDNEELVGIVTRRDVRFEKNMELTAKEVMTAKEKLVTVKEGTAPEEVTALLHKHKLEKILVVDDNQKLKGLITVKDIRSARDYPNACKDRYERLRVGAAIPARG